MPALAAVFIAGQPIFLSNTIAATGTPGQIKLVAWLVWAVALLIALAFAGGHFRGPNVRRLMEDESTLANRAKGYAAGFWAAMIMAVAMYALSLFDNLKGREAVHLILSVSIAAALIRFGLLERRALKGD